MNDPIAKNVSNLVAYVNGNDIVILNGDGFCVASSDQGKVGSPIDFSLKEPTKTSIKINDQVNTVLNFEKNQFDNQSLEFIKSLTKLTLEQYINKISKPSNSIDQFISHLVENPFATKEDLMAYSFEAETFGIDLEENRVAILVQIDNFTEENIDNNSSYCDPDEIIKDWKEKIVGCINGFFTLKTDIVTAYTGDGRFIVFKQIIGDPETFYRYMRSAYTAIFGSLIDTEKDNFHIGLSNCHTGIEGIRECYHEASQALTLGRKFIKKKDQGYYYDDLGTLRIITEENELKKKSFALEVLEPLGKEALRLTLETFLNEDMDIKKTAAKLKIHPNTVNYRLGKISEHLGLDPRIFRQAFELRIALLTDRIFT